MEAVPGRDDYHYSRPLAGLKTTGSGRKIGSKKQDPIKRGKAGRGMRKRRRTIVVSLVIIYLLSAVVQFDLTSGDIDAPTSSADYGIFNSISSINEEKAGRSSDPEVNQRVQEIEGSVSRTEYDFGSLDVTSFHGEEIDVPAPITHSPVVFDALLDNPIINNTSILDWVLPAPMSTQGALNYLALAHNDGKDQWLLGSMVARIGVFTDSSLDKWLYVNLDDNANTGDSGGYDVRLRLTFARDILEQDWELSLIPLSLTFNNAGGRIEIEALTDLEDIIADDCSVYFVKGISYDSKNYIWSIGFSLLNFKDRLEVRIEAREFSARPDFIGLLQNGLVNLGDMNIMEILGPYTISYEFRTPVKDLDIYVSVMRVFDQSIVDRAYVNLNLAADSYHENLIPKGSIILKAVDSQNPIEGLEWIGGDPESPQSNDTVSFYFRYVEFGDDLVDGHLYIPRLPQSLNIDLDTRSESGLNVSIIDITTISGIDSIHFIEVLYPDWNGNATLLDDWMATELELRGIPPSVHIETTSTPPFEVGESTSSGIGTQGLDLLMTQVSGRFYRIGRILRELPTSIIELPSRKGFTVIDCGGDSIYSVSAVLTDGFYLNGTGNYVAFYEGSGDSVPISLHINDLRFYRASFLDKNEMIIGLASPSTLRIYSYGRDRETLLMIEDPPEEIILSTSPEVISYSGTTAGQPSRLKSLFYGYRDGGLYFDANILNVPSSFTLNRGEGIIDVHTDFGAIGTIELFVTDSRDLAPVDISGRNFISTLTDNGSSALSLRFNRLSSFVYDNGSAGYIELSTEGESNLYVFVEDRQLDMDIFMALTPLPGWFHVDLPTLFEKPHITLPDISGIQSVTAYGELLHSISDLGRAFLQISPEISGAIANSIGTYSTGFSLSWDLTRELTNMDLLIEIHKNGDAYLPEPKWTHGIWLEQNGSGEESSIRGRIFLPGMPSRGEVNLSFSAQTIYAFLDFDGYSPPFTWMLIHTSGIQDRDIELYLTDLQEGMDLLLEVGITTDLSIGGMMVVDMRVELADADGLPIQLGPMIATLTKSTPILSVRQMYLPQVPSDLDLEASIQEGVTASYSASTEIEFLYFKITKRIEGRWSQVYAIFHDLPLWFDVSVKPSYDFSIQKPFPLQGLPLIDISASGNTLDLFVEYDGSGFGQRGRFEIYASDLGNTTSSYSGDDYVIDSDGIGYLSLDVGRLPVLESFTLSSLILLGSDVEHIRIGVDMVYGLYPVISLKDARGGGIQLKLTSELNLNDNHYRPNLFFITLKQKEVLGIEFYYGITVNRDSVALDMESNDGGKVMPAPILSFWYFVLTGGGG